MKRRGRRQELPAPAETHDPLVVRLVAVSAARAWRVVAVVAMGCAAMAGYVVTHFAMTTDTSALLSSKLSWRVRQTAFNEVFPQDGSGIVAVVDGRTPELSEAATARLAASLNVQKSLFREVETPDMGSFWMHEGLLFESTADVKKVLAQLLQAQPFLGSMASDPSLRGLADTVALAAKGMSSGQASASGLRAPLGSFAAALESVRLGKPYFFSWRHLITGHAPDRRELRHIILVDPVLDFTRLEPGKLPIQAIRDTARRLQLDESHGVRIRLTGPVPLQDDEFATLTQRAGLIASLAIGAIVLMLWLAVRSPYLIASILVTTLAGLVIATALGLALFHRFNVISVAFIPLFVGMGMDFGIQFCVRFRAEHGAGRDVRPALAVTARAMGKALMLAALAIGAGFLAFAPTSYHGVSQLGVIAGVGLLAALALNLTLLPALIALIRPHAVQKLGSSARVSQIESGVLRHPHLVVGTGAVAAVAAILLLPLLRFDFNPMHLRSLQDESVSTLADLTRDPGLSPNTLEVVQPDLAAADRLARAFRNDPSVSGARTLSTFIPTGQPTKIGLIADAANLMDLTLNPVAVAPPPTDREVIAGLQHAASQLRQAPGVGPRLRSVILRLADELDALARANEPTRARAARLLIPGFVTTLERIRAMLQTRSVSIETLPPYLVRQWLSPDGRARASVAPKGDSNDDAVLRRFVAAGTRVAPHAVGPAVYAQDYGAAVVRAFLEAGALSFIVICSLLFIALHRVRDVAVTMAPIVLTGLLTMGTCVLIGQPLNFANIIALPLLFGIGVAFHIYFIMAARAGSAHLLTSSVARAVFFSALATATGFGSLWASKDPGTASMGKLLMISLVWTLASALLFQPALIELQRRNAPAAELTSGDYHSPCRGRRSRRGRLRSRSRRRTARGARSAD